MKRFFTVAALAAFLFTATAAHAVDPGTICRTGKLKASGKYASCVLSADALANGTPPPSVDGVARSFTDNGNGTVGHDITGLTWEKLSDDGTIRDKDNYYPWADASAVKVEALNSASFAGQTDRRVRSRLELETLLDLSTDGPAAYSAIYRSATTGANGPSAAWDVLFYGGDVNLDSKFNTNHLRAVRGGS